MKIGFVGLGKLGLPVAVTMVTQGFDVIGYDIDRNRMSYEQNTNNEAGIFPGDEDLGYHLKNSSPHIRGGNLTFGTLEEVCGADIVFVAVQTPHQPEFEGITPLTELRADFNYSHLKEVILSMVPHVKRAIPIVIISTALPGSMEREIQPLMSTLMRLVYNPLFIAMGTAMADFMKPEFVLLGSEDVNCLALVEQFYNKFYQNHPVNWPYAVLICKMSIASAELTKCAYNTYIGQKIVFANTIMEIAQKTKGVNCDDVTDALRKATDRLISPRYMSGGMGDGGGCHPRENVALSFLARKLNLSYNVFDDMIQAREDQTMWLAEMMGGYELPKCILGYAFKPETNLTLGSPALLLKRLLEDKGKVVGLLDWHVDKSQMYPPPDRVLGGWAPHVFLIGCKHADFVDVVFPRGSIVIDPWRYIRDQEGVKVIRLGDATSFTISMKIED